MLVLGVDASLPMLSVALLDGRSLIGATSLQGKGSRNEKLLPAIDWLLSENGVDRRAIELFAVTRGPGSFTGVRIGLATVQGLALALGRDVCAMPTHEAIAAGSVERTAVVDDAGRGESYISLFEQGREIVAARLVSAAEREEIIRSATQTIVVTDYVQYANAAIGCARRAIDLTESGEAGDYRDVTPIYVRLAEAEVKLNQKSEIRNQKG